MMALSLNPVLSQSRTAFAEPEDDQQLMARVQQRSKSALAVLYERYAARAMGVAFKIVQDRDLAEEVVQEAFWRVWQRAAQFKAGRGTYANWLFGIVRHLALDMVRRRREFYFSDQDDDVSELFTHSATLTDEAHGADPIDAARVRAAIKTLPNLQRQVIELAYFQGLTRQQIANELDEPLGTIHTRAALALSKLREMVRAEVPASIIGTLPTFD